MQNNQITNPVHQSNMDLMHLLISIPGFQISVSKIRRKYKLPEKGLDNYNDKQIKEWDKKLMKTDKNVLAWLEDVKNLWWKCEKLRHDNRYINHIKTYIIFNQTTAPFTNYSINIKKPYDLEKREFSIRCYGVLTTDEIPKAMKLLRSTMQHWIPSIKKQSRPKQTLERDIMAYNEKCNKGSSIRDIVITVYEDVDDDSIKADKKRKAVLRKSIQRTSQEIEDRIGWDIS